MSLLTDKRFLVRLGTTRTSCKVREGVGEQEPMWVMGKEDPLPTLTSSLPIYGYAFSSWDTSEVICVDTPKSVYQYAVSLVMV